MNTKSASESFGKMLTNGTVVYRDVGFRSNTSEGSKSCKAVLTPTPEIPKGDRGNYMLRINVSGQHGLNPIAFVSESYNRGVVLFVNEEIPGDWTHLVVSGTTFRWTPAGFTGAVFATVPKPYNMDAYLEFRTQMYNTYAEMSGRVIPWHDKFRRLRAVCPPENRPEEVHLFSELAGKSGVWFYEKVFMSTAKPALAVARK